MLRASALALAVLVAAPTYAQLAGRVTLSGPVPKLAARPVNADAAVCGRTDRPSPSLVLSKDKGLANAVV